MWTPNFIQICEVIWQMEYVLTDRHNLSIHLMQGTHEMECARFKCIATTWKYEGKYLCNQWLEHTFSDYPTDRHTGSTGWIFTTSPNQRVQGTLLFKTVCTEKWFFPKYSVWRGVLARNSARTSCFSFWRTQVSMIMEPITSGFLILLV